MTVYRTVAPIEKEEKPMAAEEYELKTTKIVVSAIVCAIAVISIPCTVASVLNSSKEVEISKHKAEEARALSDKASFERKP